MRSRLSRLLVTVAMVLSATIALPGAAGAEDGVFAWTKITTPSKDFTYHFDSAEGAVNHLTISGTAEASISSVHIFCGITRHGGLDGAYVAQNVPVSNGTFTTEATIPSTLGICRLRAWPSNLPNIAYLGSFSGPLMYSWAYGKLMDSVDGTKLVAFAVATAHGSGVAGLSEASVCAALLMGTVNLSVVQSLGPWTPMCGFGLPPANITTSGTPTATSVRVDGKNAWTPAGISGLRDPNGPTNLTLSQPSITVSFSRNATSGDVMVTESTRLWRCSGDNANVYPPTGASCPSIVNTGVTFKRVLELTRGHHQLLIHDSYVSNDGQSHTVNAQYVAAAARAPYGAPGFTYPNHAGSFQKATFDKVVTGFGTGPGTVFGRSDVYASTTDPDADTQAFTWSRPPSKIQFTHTDTAAFGMPYVFQVPAGGQSKIAFAVSEAPTTAAAKTLAAKAVAAL